MLNFLFLFFQSINAINPDATYSFIEYCNHYGFRAENHTVTTQDGYILMMFRIPGYLNETVTNDKPVIFLQHGLIDNSDNWITNLPDQAPAFVLSRAGFDIWLGNSRGNRYSIAHTTLSTSSAAFWAFSWQEMAKYDLPASVDYVLEYTGKQKLTYVGHSQGTSLFLAHIIDNPEFMDKINLGALCAPIATARNLEVTFLSLVKSAPLFSLASMLGIHQFMPYTNTPGIEYELCNWLNLICSSVLNFFTALTTSFDDTDRLDVFVAHEPGGTSIQDMKYWQQMVNQKVYQMQKYDFGDSENMAVYGQATPPIYDLSKVKGPLALFSGLYDRLADPTDVAWLYEQIKEAVIYTDNAQNAGHLTFMWGKDTHFYLDKLIELAKQYSQE